MDYIIFWVFPLQGRSGDERLRGSCEQEGDCTFTLPKQHHSEDAFLGSIDAEMEK